jgi:hypothetical protein
MGITDTINPSEIKKPVHEVSEFTIYNHKLIRVLNWVRNFSDEEFKDDICWVVGGWWQSIREMTGGGVDYSFECAGNLDVLREAFSSTHEVH